MQTRLLFNHQDFLKLKKPTIDEQTELSPNFLPIQKSAVPLNPSNCQMDDFEELIQSNLFKSLNSTLSIESTRFLEISKFFNKKNVSLILNNMPVIQDQLSDSKWTDQQIYLTKIVLKDKKNRQITIKIKNNEKNICSSIFKCEKI